MLKGKVKSELRILMNSDMLATIESAFVDDMPTSIRLAFISRSKTALFLAGFDGNCMMFSIMPDAELRGSVRLGIKCEACPD